MINAGEYQGKLLISITNGEKLGAVKDLYFDSELTNVTAIRRGTKDLLFTQILDAIAQADGKVSMASATLQLVETPTLDIRLRKE